MADYHTDNAVFLVYKDWETLFDSLDSNEEAGELIKALFAFAKRGEIAEFSGALKMAFIIMSRQLDKDGTKWEEKCVKNAENVKKRWKRTDTTVYDPIPSDTNCTDKDKEKDKDKEEDIILSADKPQPRKRFVPPSVEDVREYCQERKNNVDAQRFVDYYTSNGWHVGKNPMKDWKAAVRTWERQGWNGYGYGGEKKKEQPKDVRISCSSISDEDLEKIMNPYGI